MTIAIILIALVVLAFVVKTFFGTRPSNEPLNNKMAASINAMTKLKDSVDMFRSGISADRLRRDADESDLHYYIGYITALARSIAKADGVQPDGTILTSVQIEASRLCGKSADINGSYEEGIQLLPTILLTNSGRLGLEDGQFDGQHAVNRKNPGPYFERLRMRFGVKSPSAQ